MAPSRSQQAAAVLAAVGLGLLAGEIGRSAIFAGTERGASGQQSLKFRCRNLPGLSPSNVFSWRAQQRAGYSQDKGYGGK